MQLSKYNVLDKFVTCGNSANSSVLIWSKTFTPPAMNSLPVPRSKRPMSSTRAPTEHLSNVGRLSSSRMKKQQA